MALPTHTTKLKSVIKPAPLTPERDGVLDHGTPDGGTTIIPIKTTNDGTQYVKDIDVKAILDDVKALLEQIEGNTDEVEVKIDTVNLNTDTLEQKLLDILAELQEKTEPADTQVVEVVGSVLPDGASTEAKQDTQIAKIGEVQPSPTDNTVLERLKQIHDRIGEISVTPVANTVQERLKDIQAKLASIINTDGIKKITDPINLKVNDTEPSYSENTTVPFRGTKNGELYITETEREYNVYIRSHDSFASTSRRLFIDLSDNTNYKHSGTTRVDISTIEMSADRSNTNFDFVYRLGIISELTASDGKIKWIHQLTSELSSETHFDHQINYSPSQVKTDRIITNDEETVTWIGTTTMLPNIFGTNVTVAVGDIVQEFQIITGIGSAKGEMIAGYHGH